MIRGLYGKGIKIGMVMVLLGSCLDIWEQSQGINTTYASEESIQEQIMEPEEKEMEIEKKF